MHLGIKDTSLSQTFPLFDIFFDKNVRTPIHNQNISGFDFDVDYVFVSISIYAYTGIGKFKANSAIAVG